MNKEQVLTAIAKEHAALDRVLAPLDEATVTLPGVYDALSIKDVLAHLAAWERLEAEWIQASLRGETPVRFTPDFPLGGADTNDLVDRLNARVFVDNRDRPLAEVLDSFRAAQAALRAAIASLSESDLTDPGRFDWRGGEPLWPNVAGNSFDHYREHRELIEAWLHQRSAFTPAP